jgi:hypothetical protein
MRKPRSVKDAMSASSNVAILETRVRSGHKKSHDMQVVAFLFERIVGRNAAAVPKGN